VQPRKAALAFIFVTVALDMLALGMIIPVLPDIIKGFLGGDTGAAAHYYGLFGTTWATMQFFFAPVLGALSDRFGRRPVVLISNFGLGLDYLLTALAPGLSWLFLARGISGPTTQGMMSRRVDATEQGAMQGAIGSINGITGMVGPAMFASIFAGAIADPSAALPGAPFLVSAGLLLLAIDIVVLVVRRQRAPEPVAAEAAPPATGSTLGA
jgi:MFS transporter, DHA1 family, tetracycline resistance protein